jgi:hypothetical protein
MGVMQREKQRPVNGSFGFLYDKFQKEFPEFIESIGIEAKAKDA